MPLLYEKASTHVFSPWSVLNFLTYPQDGFKNYWFESGGKPTVLRKYFEGHTLKNPAFYSEEKSISLSDLGASADLQTMGELPLLVQSGYLTIKRALGGTVFLDFPNREVSQSMGALYTEQLLRRKNLVQVGAGNLMQDAAQGNADGFVSALNKAFLALDYTHYPVKDEVSCRHFIQVFLAGANLCPRPETHNALGRSDLEFEAGCLHWVLELKFARQSDAPEAKLKEAADQIRARHYGSGQAKKLLRLAMVYSEKERHFVAWQQV